MNAIMESIDHADDDCITDLDSIAHMMMGLNEDIQKIKFDIQEQIDSLEQGIESILKGSDKIKERIVIKSLKKILKGIPEMQLYLSTLKSYEIQDILDSGKSLYETGMISKHVYLLTEHQIKQATNRFTSFQRELNRLKKKLEEKLKKKLKVPNSAGFVVNDTCSSYSYPGLKSSQILISQLPIVDSSNNQNSATLDDKVSQIQTRFTNIINSSTLTEYHISELQIMKSRLQEFNISENTIVADTVFNLLKRIESVLSAGIVTTPSISRTGAPSIPIGVKGVSILEISTENQRFIEYIRFVRSNVITYKDSSKKGGESIGDGNFIAHIWKPFLARLELLLQNNSINAEEFSWNNAIDIIYSTQDGIDNRNRLKAFCDQLKNSNGLKNWQENYIQVLSTIKDFSKDERYFADKPGVTPLKNILEKLIQNYPVHG